MANGFEKRDVQLGVAHFLTHLAGKMAVQMVATGLEKRVVQLGVAHFLTHLAGEMAPRRSIFAPFAVATGYQM